MYHELRAKTFKLLGKKKEVQEECKILIDRNLTNFKKYLITVRSEWVRFNVFM